MTEKQENVENDHFWTENKCDGHKSCKTCWTLQGLLVNPVNGNDDSARIQLSSSAVSVQWKIKNTHQKHKP